MFWIHFLIWCSKSTWTVLFLTFLRIISASGACTLFSWTSWAHGAFAFTIRWHQLRSFNRIPYKITMTSFGSVGLLNNLLTLQFMTMIPKMIFVFIFFELFLFAAFFVADEVADDNIFLIAFKFGVYFHYLVLLDSLLISIIKRIVTWLFLLVVYDAVILHIFIKFQNQTIW